MPKSDGYKNLVDKSAPDNPGETGTITVRLSLADLEWLKAQPEGSSFHIRQAIKLYRSHKSKQ